MQSKHVVPHPPPEEAKVSSSPPEADAAGCAAESPAMADCTYAMMVAYDGYPFQGWQVQPHGPSVQAKLEQALALVTGQAVKVYGSGRTDSGVHAWGQIAHFAAPGGLDTQKLRRSLNGLCAPAVAVRAIVPASPEFHARHSAVGKTYRYHLFNRGYPPVFGKHRCWWIRAPLDTAAMARAGEALTGTHDFSAFRAKECAAVSPVREITSLALVEVEEETCTLRVEVAASGFLQHMARIIEGTLVAVGRGALPADSVGEILARRERERAGPTAPGRGLYLHRVAYDLERFPELRELMAAASAPPA